MNVAASTSESRRRIGTWISSTRDPVFGACAAARLLQAGASSWWKMLTSPSSRSPTAHHWTRTVG